MRVADIGKGNTGDPLGTVALRIEHYAQPAYIKDSQLRYVAVNAAYAALRGMAAEQLLGKTDEVLANPSDESDRDEKERRSLVFGKDQIALFSDPRQDDRYRIRISRGSRTDGSTFVVGYFEAYAGVQYRDSAMPAPRFRQPGDVSGDGAANDPDMERIREAFEATEEPIAVCADDGRPIVSNAAYRAAREAEGETLTQVRADGGSRLIRAKMSSHERNATKREPSRDMSTLALDTVDAGIVIYDADDVICLVNARMKTIFGANMPAPVPGTTLRQMVAALYDTEALERGQADDGESDRAAWIAGRLALYRQPFGETIERISGGRWIKAVGRRLENGTMMAVITDITELKDRESQLERKVAEIGLYKAVLDELPHSTYVKDEDFKLTFINRAYTALTGMSEADAIGRSDVDLFGEEGRPLLEQDQRLFESGEISEQEEALSHSSGRKMTLLSRKTRVKMADGARYMIGSSFDITGHKQREVDLFEAQREAELMRSDLESVVDGLDMGVMVFNADDTIELINEAYFSIWNLEVRDVVGKHARFLLELNRTGGAYDVSDEKWEAFVEARLAEIRSGDVSAREMVLADGRTLIYSVRTLSMGKRMVTHFDITDQKARQRDLENAQAALEETSSLMRGATAAMAQGLCIYDDTIRLTNDAFHEMIGLDRDEICAGMTFEAMIRRIAARGDYGDPEQTARTIEDILAKGRHQIPHLIERHGADGRWLRIDAKPAAQGMMITTYTDMTETKNREEELKRLLVQSELADRAKSEFLANMSHEIRTPMNGVLGMAELLAKTALDTRQKTFTDVIVKSGNALLTIINDILDFSKIDAGRLVLDPAPFSLAESIEDVATLISSQIAEKDIELIVRTAPDLPERLIGDVGRVRQIITNLVGNAAKFTEVGHVLIDVSAESMNGDKADVVVRIEDTGIGIPEEKLKSIFEKFSQVDGSSTRRHEGTGLGLAIAMRLAEMMDGSIAVESVPGEGSTFTIRLSFAIDAAAPAPRRMPIDVSGARVVVIDDNHVNRAILLEQLNAWGFDGCAVEDGSEGLDVLRAAMELNVGADCVILDYHMPGMNGADVAVAMRNDPDLAELPVIMLTSVDIKSDEERFPEMKIQAHLMKPARSSLLLETLISVLQKKKGVQSGLPGTEGIRPASQMPPEAAMDFATSDAVDPQSRDVSGPDTILVAEDNEVNQIVFSQILEELDIAYTVVCNGEEAVNAHRQRPPSMILMDVSMPVMNGYEATQAIRKREETTGAHVPIVGVTAHALKGDRERCIEAGMDDYLSKPISPEKLSGKIRDWLGTWKNSLTA